MKLRLLQLDMTMTDKRAEAMERPGAFSLGPGYFISTPVYVLQVGTMKTHADKIEFEWEDVPVVIEGVTDGT